MLQNQVERLFQGDWVVGSTSHFFVVATQFLLERTNSRQAVVIETRAFGRHFLSNEQNELSLKGKQLKVFVASDKIWVSQHKSELKKNVYLPSWAWQLPNAQEAFFWCDQ